MTTTPATRHLPRTRLDSETSCARRVVVIPLDDDGSVLTIAVDAPARLVLPSRVKALPRIPTDDVADTLLRIELGCALDTDLRLIALLPPSGAGESLAVYTAHTSWPGTRPIYTRRGHHPLIPVRVKPDNLHPARVADLLPGGADLAAALRDRPDIRHTAASAI